MPGGAVRIAALEGQVEVFGLDAEIVPEGVFDAAADDGAGGGSRPAAEVRRSVIDEGRAAAGREGDAGARAMVAPHDAGGAEDEEAIEGEAGASAECRVPIQVARHRLFPGLDGKGRVCADPRAEGAELAAVQPAPLD